MTAPERGYLPYKVRGYGFIRRNLVFAHTQEKKTSSSGRQKYGNWVSYAVKFLDERLLYYYILGNEIGIPSCIYL